MHIEDEVNLKEILRKIYRYRYMILSITFLFFLGSVYYAYFKPDIYKATATVEVGLGQQSARGDLLSMAMEPGQLYSDTEMGIIKSRFLVRKALEKVDFVHRYYTEVNFKERELYKSSPFEVGMLRGQGISFVLEPVDEMHYRLIVNKQKNHQGSVWEYDQVHLYGKEIITPHFHLNVVKKAPFQYERYRFVVLREKSIEGSVQGRVSVEQQTEYSTLLNISFEDTVPLRAQEFTNALAEAYIVQNIEKKTQEATKKLDFIDRQLKLITENLKSSAVKLEEFKRNSNTVNLSSKAETIIRQMSAAESKLEEISIESEMLDTLYKQIKKGKNIESLSVVGLNIADSGLASKIKELQDAIIRKKILREDYTEMYPEVVKLKRQIQQLKKIIVSSITNIRNTMKEKKALIEKTIQKYQKQLNEVPADERMYGQLKRKFAVNEKIYSYLLEKRSETAIIKASTVSKNRVLDRALLPASPIKPKRKQMILIGTLLGLVLGISLAFLRDYLDDRVHSEEDIRHGIEDVALLGTIPHIEEKSEEIQVFTAPKSVLTEAFRNLRSNLQFMMRGKKSGVIAVTSTIAGEGKTTICTNLAGIMSTVGKKTIVINLDMRKPTLHKRFDLPNIQGISTLLSGNTTLEHVIQKTEYDNLDVITSGPVPPNPSELLHSELMEQVIKELKEVYDVIILDTPPMGIVSDIRSLMPLIDTTIYVMRVDYSKKAFLNNIKEFMSFAEIHGFGILLNDLKREKYRYGYGYGYGYYEEDK